jgi:glycosyltransferase involved in cell wall biosynthesis
MTGVSNSLTRTVPARIRILTLIESIYAVGPARSIIEIARAAAQPRPDLPSLDIMIATYHRGAGDSPFAKAAREAGVTAFTIPEQGRFDKGAMRKLHEIVEQVKPDIVESQNIKSHLFVRLLKLYRRYPWVIWNHGYTATSLLDRIYTQVDRWSLRKAFRAVAVCGVFAERLHKRGMDRHRIEVKHSFVRPFVEPLEEEVESARRVLGISDQAVILAVGRLSQEKGHADLFQALAILTRVSGVPKFRAVIVGDGPERENLAALALRLGIQESVVMAGFQKDVRPFYRMATMLALPSHTEGSPYVLLEAMMASLPVAATRVGGVPEHVENGVTGLLVPGRDPAAMAEALQKLLINPPLRKQLGAAGHLYATNNHSFETYVESLIRFYQETLENYKRAACQMDISQST